MPLHAAGDPGEWDCGAIYACNFPIVVGDEMRSYYGGSTRGHRGDDDVKTFIRLATRDLAPENESRSDVRKMGSWTG